MLFLRILPVLYTKELYKSIGFDERPDNKKMINVGNASNLAKINAKWNQHWAVDMMEIIPNSNIDPLKVPLFRFINNQASVQIPVPPNLIEQMKNVVDIYDKQFLLNKISIIAFWMDKIFGIEELVRELNSTAETIGLNEEQIILIQKILQEVPSNIITLFNDPLNHGSKKSCTEYYRSFRNQVCIKLLERSGYSETIQLEMRTVPDRDINSKEIEEILFSLHLFDDYFANIKSTISNWYSLIGYSSLVNFNSPYSTSGIESETPLEVIYSIARLAKNQFILFGQLYGSLVKNINNVIKRVELTEMEKKVSDGINGLIEVYEHFAQKKVEIKELQLKITTVEDQLHHFFSLVIELCLRIYRENIRMLQNV